MALITKVEVFAEAGSVPEGASRHFVYIPAIYLSYPYELASGDLVHGRVTHVKKGMEEIVQLRDASIMFILEKGTVMDRLFIDKSNWIKYFRDWGLVAPGYFLDLKLFSVTQMGTNVEVSLYPNKDFAF